MSKILALKPRLSEKSYGQSQSLGVYVFDVPKTTSKVEINRAIETQFEVSVETINIVIVKGKPKRTMRRGGRPTSSKRSDVKKAYVKLKPGDTIPVFAALEDNEAKPTPKATAKEGTK